MSPTLFFAVMTAMASPQSTDVELEPTATVESADRQPDRQEKKKKGAKKGKGNAGNSTASPPGPPLAKRLPREEMDQRTQKHHAFIAPFLSDSALVTSHFEFRQGAAILSVPSFTDPRYEDTTYDLMMIGAGQSIDVGVRFLWFLGAYAHVDGVAALGANAESALYTGASAALDWEAGGHAMLFRSKKLGMQISLRAKVLGRQSTAVAPGPLVDAFIADPVDTVEELGDGELVNYLVSSQSNIWGGGSLNFAQAFNRMFSVQGSFEVSGGAQTFKSFDGSDVQTSVTALQLGAGLTGTLDGWPWFPVAAQVEYRWDELLAMTDDADAIDTHRLGGGLFYSGHPDLVLGVVANGVLPSEEVGPQYVQAQLVMKIHL